MKIRNLFGKLKTSVLDEARGWLAEHYVPEAPALEEAELSALEAEMDLSTLESQIDLSASFEPDAAIAAPLEAETMPAAESPHFVNYDILPEPLAGASFSGQSFAAPLEDEADEPFEAYHAAPAASEKRPESAQTPRPEPYAAMQAPRPELSAVVQAPRPERPKESRKAKLAVPLRPPRKAKNAASQQVFGSPTGSALSPEVRPAFSQTAAIPSSEEIKDILRGLDEGFSSTLLALIDSRGLKDADVYNRAGLSRQYFNKIKNDPQCKPGKAIVLSLCAALELGPDAAADLLQRAGFAFSTSSKFDQLVLFCFTKGIFEIGDINDILYAFDQPLLGGVQA